MIDVILPVLDERLALPGVLASMPAGYRAIVVDNGSTDGSGPLAVELGAVVVTEPRRGFGAACWAGLTAATSEIVCFMDCDGSLDGADLVRVTAPLAAGATGPPAAGATGPADLVLGRRRPDPG
jgi:glycosyltransferase involved in cell wall biosynthesis